MDVIDIKGDGAASLMPLLTNWSLSDSEGMQSDRLSLTFSGMESQTLIPKSGAEWRVFIDGEKRGVYQISSISEYLHPVKLVVQLTPAIFCVADEKGFKEPRRRTFPPARIQDVVKAVMEPHGYEVRVSPKFAYKPTEHLNQNEETDSAFIARLAAKHDAIAKPIDRMYVFGQRGSLKTLSGNEQPVVTITPQDVQQGSAKLAHPSFVRFNGVKAHWQTPDTGLSDTQVIGSKPYFSIKDVFKHPGEAQVAAEAKLAEFKRKIQSFSATLRGQPGLFAESVMILQGFQSPRAKGRWSVDSVTLSGTRTSYTIQVEATRPI
ncbi:hypothetical protein GTG28_18060 [Vibrio sp. OCN044]|uniref:Phage protein D n=1 Tax=Vibrio tetraodonis subsp. pristinus TaxID=2695891 RepID=A0A6L8LYH0_9VIBR|nr:contractile injection system protein, VgrG/Pvc8 family [Vibrio tetraodonis]MYM61137.1 hypothetical protein [Vibrio tetraodonis subsp. pristinus]